MTEMPIPTIETGLSKLEREKLIRACVVRCRGEGWTVRYDLQLDAWHVRQGGDNRIMGIPGLAHFTGRAAELQCRKCGCSEHHACVDRRGSCWWVQYDLCSHCHDPADRAADKDVCSCGDFRDQHRDGWGRCGMADDECHGFNPCLRFDLHERAIAPS